MDGRTRLHEPWTARPTPFTSLCNNLTQAYLAFLIFGQRSKTDPALCNLTVKKWKAIFWHPNPILFSITEQPLSLRSRVALNCFFLLFLSYLIPRHSKPQRPLLQNVLCSGNIPLYFLEEGTCSCLRKWYRYLFRMHKVPGFFSIRHLILLRCR